MPDRKQTKGSSRREPDASERMFRLAMGAVSLGMIVGALLTPPEAEQIVTETLSELVE